jgi:Tfp pilus assembly protein PilO
VILEAAKAKLAPYLVPIIGTLVVVVAGAFWWLWSDREQLLEENSTLTQAMEQAKVTNQENLNQIARLEADIAWRDQQAVIRSEREQFLNDQLAAAEAELKELVKDAPCSGPEYVWPDAVYERMRAGTVADPNRVREKARAGGLPGAAKPASSAQAD